MQHALERFLGSDRTPKKKTQQKRRYRTGGESSAAFGYCHNLRSLAANAAGIR